MGAPASCEVFADVNSIASFEYAVAWLGTPFTWFSATPIMECG